MPWSEFGNFWGITPWRMVVLGICIMLVRRIPAVMALVSRESESMLTFRAA
jgi:NhaP-type Na+/H+ or K+/H+ antiporter